MLALASLTASLALAAILCRGADLARPMFSDDSWNRPGCHLLGHTRIISIPGCVKFELSTNACRGYCMSFSIPSADDIGPAPPDRLGELDDGTRSGGATRGHSPTASTQQQLMALLNRHSQLVDQEQHQQAQLMGSFIADRKYKKARHSGTKGALPVLGEQSGNSTLTDQDIFLHLSGQMRSPLSGAVGDLSAKRDVISVGQCCNMVETSDVTVNLRCGLNETRRLVFKSAKSCECFFCKHV